MYRCYQTIGPNQWLVIALNHSVWIYTAHFNDSFKWLSQVYCSVFPFGNYNCICFCILSNPLFITSLQLLVSVIGSSIWVVYYFIHLLLSGIGTCNCYVTHCLVLLNCSGYNYSKGKNQVYPPPNNGWIVLGITIPTPVITILISNPEVCILGKSAQLIQELRFFLCIYPGKEERSTKVSLCIVTVQLYRASLSVIQDCWSFIPSHCEHKTSLVTATQGTFG